MKRYSFPLAQVLRVRRIEEDRAAGRLAAAQSAATAASEAVEERRDALGGCAAPEEGPASRFIGWCDQVTRAGTALTVATAALVEAEADLAVRRREWSDAAMRVSALERLDTRRRELHRDGARRDEAAANDDIVTRKSHR